MRMNIEFQRFCKNIRVLRKNKNLTQLELAEKINVSKTTINFIEAGHGTSFETMFNLADFFEVFVADLFSKDYEIVEEEKLDFEKTRKEHGRFSGLKYENPPEKLEAIKEKYKNGVTMDILEEFADKIL